MRKVLIFIVLVSFYNTITFAKDPEKTKVILLGVFHFDNPGLDVAKFKDVDILSEVAQEELERITKNIAKYGPQKIFLEATSENSEYYNKIINNYSEATLEKYSNEIIQIGIRLMKLTENDKVYFVDHQLELPIDSLFQTWNANSQEDYLNKFMEFIKRIEGEFNQYAEQSLKIGEILKLMNSPEYRKFSLAPYTSTEIMDAGKPGNFIGADVASDWYKRNIRIYSNIIRDLDGNEDTIFIMFGAGHIPIIEHLFSLHSDKYEIVDITSSL